MLTFAKSELERPHLQRIKGHFFLVFALKSYVFLLQYKDLICDSNISGPGFVFCLEVCSSHVAITAGCSSSDHHLC